jgi:hypothetical protein
VVADLTFEEGSAEFLQVGEQNITLGGIFKFKFPELLPYDPWNYYNPNSFFDIMFEEEPIRQNTTKAQLIVFKSMINAPSLTLYNGSVLTLPDIHEIRGLFDPAITSTEIDMLEPYPQLTQHIVWPSEEGIDDWWVVYDIHPDSGIVSTVSFDFNDEISMELEFLESSSSLRIDGTTNESYTEGTQPPPTKSLDGFTWLLSSLLLVIIPLYKRRR